MRPEHKVAIITGSASGRGQVAAETFARKCACVIVTDIAVLAGEETAWQICSSDGQTIFMQANAACCGRSQTSDQRGTGNLWTD